MAIDVKAPSLSGTTVWLPGREGNGYDVSFSADTKSKIHGILEACGEVDDKCYQEVRQLLRNADLQIDGELERRGFVQFLSKTFKKVGSVFSFIAGVLISNWAMKQEQPTGMFVPHEIASQASKLETTTPVVSADGTAVATITSTPDPTVLQGSQTPSVTPVTEPEGDSSSGDLIAFLDEDLASRIDEVMHRSQDCDDGHAFVRGDQTRRKRANGGFGKAICAAEAAAVMSQRGGPFNDLLLINPAHLSFDFAETAGAVARAANVASDFVRACTPMLDISPALAEQLGNLLFALAVNTLIENRPVNQNNRIEASLIRTEAPTALPTSCPDPKSTPVTFACWTLYMPAPTDSTIMASFCSEHQGCECNAPSESIENNASDEEQKSMIIIADLFESIGPPNSPKCEHDKLSDIPSNVFYSSENKVSGRFCEQWDESTKLEMIVGASGEDRKPQFEESRSLQRRTPPPDPSNYSKYDFRLRFAPAKEKKKCAMDCNTAYLTLATACQNNGAARWTWSMELSTMRLKRRSSTRQRTPPVPDPITPAKTPLKVFPRFCFAAEAFGDHGDIQPSMVRDYSSYPCYRSSAWPIKQGDKSTFRRWATMTNNVPYQFNIYWKHGCVSEGPDEAYSTDPLNSGKPDYKLCYDTMRDNYRKCNNGGVSGNIQIGCLVYEFKAQAVQ
ncbi:uncharacterized protein VDAG_08707 [Verticillium dahliae VdLs.17]|uniref:Uncharacterized protein n=1 Tax=Verticillium dahliae (strain VdLs.17 / ATCC MYA-4575 / FGSC 10137) TaxID=498257 RepID=G2XEX5_VERDV|nr:uncharacterized protein VDAG_08707 [Verticillium dahliae VdLs.17]EGY18373.1 hypothetical protein VDAG_08707 [Verticillium dahliae VdLs.17]KAH6686524.1 hypothetical protein EV126DRAFT_463783 [Verticillium dahliae]